MEKIVEKFELYGKEYRLETGELAKQTTGAVLVGQGDTTVPVTAVISNQAAGIVVGKAGTATTDPAEIAASFRFGAETDHA